ncbi:MAG: hypothetical protein AB1847_19025 [bacterium]
MPVICQQLIPANAGLATYNVAKELARQTVAQFGAVRWIGVGIAGASCCAALAINPAPAAFFPAGNPLMGFLPPPAGVGVISVPNFGVPALPYAIVYGNSQLAPGGLALGPLGGHAERAALTASVAAGMPLPLYLLPAGGHAVLFVELHPCPGCLTWLNGGGGGVGNPYNGIINTGGATTLDVWWKWPHPAGVGQMNMFHQQGLAAQLAQINGPTW